MLPTLVEDHYYWVSNNKQSWTLTQCCHATEKAFTGPGPSGKKILKENASQGYMFGEEQPFFYCDFAFIERALIWPAIAVWPLNI